MEAFTIPLHWYGQKQALIRLLKTAVEFQMESFTLVDEEMSEKAFLAIYGFTKSDLGLALDAIKIAIDNNEAKVKSDFENFCKNKL